MTKLQSIRLRRILSYALSNQQCYEACDIQTRAEIDRLMIAIPRVFADALILKTPSMHNGVSRMIDLSAQVTAELKRIGYVSIGAGDFVHHSKRKAIHCCVYSDRREIEMSHEGGYSMVTDEDSLRAFILEVQ